MATILVAVEETTLNGRPPAERLAGPSQAAYLLSALAAPLAVAAALVGLLAPGLYRDPALLVPQARGQDLVTLLVGVPVLVGGLVAARRGSARGRLLWLGALGYLAYAYAAFAFGSHFNPLFLVYLALLGLSIYALILGLIGTDARAVAAGFGRRAPTRLVGGFFLALAGLTALLWLAEIVPALLTNSPLRSAVEAQTPTNVIHVLDLALVLPAFALAGSLLLRRRPWSYVLAGLLLAKAATLGLAILAMALFLRLDGQPVEPGLALFFAILTALALGLGAAYLRSFRPRG